MPKKSNDRGLLALSSGFLDPREKVKPRLKHMT